MEAFGKSFVFIAAGEPPGQRLHDLPHRLSGFQGDLHASSCGGFLDFHCSETLPFDQQLLLAGLRAVLADCGERLLGLNLRRVGESQGLAGTPRSTKSSLENLKD